MSLIIEEIHGADAFHCLKTEWQEVFLGSTAVPFLSWEWINSWHKIFAFKTHPRIICVRDDNRLLGLIALTEDRKGWGTVGITRLSLLGANLGGADYLGVLALEGYEEIVSDAIFNHLANTSTGELICLEEIRGNSFSHHSADRTFRSRSLTTIKSTPRYQCPQIELNSDWEGLLNRSRRADNYKRRLRQLSKMSGFEFRRCVDPKEIEAAYARFQFLHESRWQAAGGSEAVGNNALRQFHSEVVRNLAALGKVSFEELWCEGECRATIYGLEHKGHFYYFNAGYDQNWAKYSVGLVLLGLSIQAAITRGVTVYDFLRGTENYKFDWATRIQETVVLQIGNQRWPNQLVTGFDEFQAKAKAIAQKSLPTNCWRMLRTFKRQYLTG